MPGIVRAGALALWKCIVCLLPQHETHALLWLLALLAWFDAAALPVVLAALRAYSLVKNWHPVLVRVCAGWGHRFCLGTRVIGLSCFLVGLGWLVTSRNSVSIQFALTLA